MTVRKRILTAGSAVVLAAAVLVTALIQHDLNRTYTLQTENASGPALQAKIARGEYVARVADCAACHTAPEGKPFAGGYTLDTPFGKILTSNITQDRETGIGGWDEARFDRAVRHGKGRNGYLYPAMPYNAYARMSDRDIDDLWAYMKTVPAVSNAVTENQLPFPFSMRWLLSGWNLLFFKDEPFKADPTRSALLNRGAYIVDGAGHCGACHTPKNLLGGDKGDYLQGETLQGWHAPDLTSNGRVGLGGWSAADITAYLRTGANEGAVASGPMVEAVENSTQYLTKADADAVAAYLKALPASPGGESRTSALGADELAPGRAIYETQCAACHVSNGTGIRRMIPRLSANPQIVADDPSSLIKIVLEGSDGPRTHANPTGASMPRFDWKLTDRQIADLLTYVRNSWGNAADPVTEAQVSKRRAAMAPPPPAEHP